MEVKFSVTKEERKSLVAAVSELTGCASAYQGAPSFAFAVGNYIIDRNGTLVYDEQTEAAELRTLLTELAERGFVFEGDLDEIAPAAIAAPVATPSDEVDKADGDNERTPRNGDPFAEASISETPDRLALEVPLEGFSHTALDNLDKLVEGKSALIMKAIDADALPIERTESTLRFPWFPFPASHDETDAYTRFVCALCEMAKKQKRVTMKEAQIDADSSEKFAFRCFLLRLGFKGDEYKNARRVLLSKLSGSGSFKSGTHKKSAAPEAVTAADSGEDNAMAISVRACGNNADNAATGGEKAAPERCGECPHHSYYTVGPLCTSAGNVVDTSGRTPESHTHYCLGTPSGFRKIKHATDWSGLEVPASWCPLPISSNAVENSEEEAHE